MAPDKQRITPSTRDKLYTQTEIAAYLGITKQALSRRIRLGKLPSNIVVVPQTVGKPLYRITSL